MACNTCGKRCARPRFRLRLLRGTLLPTIHCRRPTVTDDTSVRIIAPPSLEIIEDFFAETTCGECGPLYHALRLAALAHHDAYRLDGTPALWHPIDVCHLLQRHGIGNSELLSASLVHDALEDNPGRDTELRDLIRSRLGQRVLGWVEALTDDPGLPDTASRKAAQLIGLRHAPWEVRMIKLADRLANLLSGPPDRWSSEKRAAYAEHSRQVLDTVAGTHDPLENSMREALAAQIWGSS